MSDFNYLKFFTFIISIFLISCGSENNEPELPEVKTLSATVFQFSSATLRGEVISSGDSGLISRGFCYGENDSEVRNNCVSVDSGRLGQYELELDDLPPETTFEYEGFARNSDGTGYGSRQAFSTGEQADWELISEIPFEDLNSINFINEREGWIAGSNGKIFKSVDSGENWTEHRVELSEDVIDRSFKKIHFTDSSNGWIVGSEGTFYITNNANSGFDWDTSRNSANQDVTDVEAADDSLVVIRSPFELVVSSNGGMSWLYFDLSFSGGPNSLFPALTFPSKNTLAISNGTALFISDDMGETWNNIKPEFSNTNGSEIEIFIQSVFFLNDRDGWILSRFNQPNDITEERFIAFTGNRGEKWEIIFIDAEGDKIGENTEKIYFFDENNGFILDRLLRTMDGGFTWQTSTSITTALDDIFFLNSENIWGISDSKIFKYSN